MKTQKPKNVIEVLTAFIYFVPLFSRISRPSASAWPFSKIRSIWRSNGIQLPPNIRKIPLAAALPSLWVVSILPSPKSLPRKDLFSLTPTLILQIELGRFLSCPLRSGTLETSGNAYLLPLHFPNFQLPLTFKPFQCLGLWQDLHMVSRNEPTI